MNIHITIMTMIAAAGMSITMTTIVAAAAVTITIATRAPLRSRP